MNALFQNSLAQALAWTLIHFLWEGLAAGLLAWAGLRLLRRNSAQARYLWACACLGLMVAAAAATFMILRPLLHAAGPLAGNAANALASVEVGSFRAALSEAPWTTRAQAAFQPFLPWALAFWSLGVALLTLRLAGAWLWLQRLRYTGVEPAGAEFQMLLNALQRRLHVDRAVRLLKSAAVEAPVVIGWMRPVILAPLVAFSGLQAESLEAILAHELAHIRRHDYLVNLLQSAVEILFFYHPAVWWLSAQIRDERENACDDVAVAACGDARLYAESLARLEELRLDAGAAPPTLALASHGGSLMNRIRRLLLPPLPPSNTVRAGLAAALAVSLLGAATTYRIVQDPASKAEPSKTRSKSRIVVRDQEKNMKVTMDGDVKVDAGSKELVKLGPGGAIELQARDGAKVKKFTARKDAKGETREWSVDGKVSPMTPADEAWLRGQLKEVKRLEGKAPKAERKVKKIILGGDGDAEFLDLKDLEDLPAIGDASPEQRREIRKVVIESRRMAKEAEGQAEEAAKLVKEMAKQAKKIQIILRQRLGDAGQQRQWNLDMHKLGEEMGHLGEAMGGDFDVFMDGEDMPGLREGAEPGPEGLPRMRVLRLHGKDGEGFRKTEIELLQKEIEHLQKRLERLQKNEAVPRGLPRHPQAPEAPRPPMPPLPPGQPDSLVPPPPPPPPAPPGPPSGGMD